MPPLPLTDREYRSLAQFRHALRVFQRFSEEAARAEGLTPSQHQLLLAVRGWDGGAPSTSDLADALQLKLHSVFLNSRRRAQDSEWSHFAARIKVVEHRIKRGLLWDTEYPGRQIYSENVELRVSDVGPDGTVTGGFNWDSDEQDWQPLGPSVDGRLRFGLRGAGALAGFVVIDVSRWPDVNETLDD